MTPDAPSPLHRAIRWSLPGAALLSIPATIALNSYWPSAFARAVDQFMHTELCFIAWGILGLVTLGTSPCALVSCWRARRGRAFAALFILIFNLAALLCAVLFVRGSWSILTAHIL